MSAVRDYAVAVVGGGPWGVALAKAAARAPGAAGRVLLVSRARGADAGEGVAIGREFSEAAAARLILLAVPSARAADVARALGPHLDGGHYVVHGVRGLVGDDLATVSEVVRALTPVRRLGAIGGPVLAPELAAGAPSVLVVGSRFPEVCQALRDAFTGPALRVYATRDLTGLEWASALTGGIAIAVGYALGVGLGPGIVAAFTSRSVHEVARLAVAAGGEQATLLGLAGLGDLLAATGQEGRPEVAIGRALAAGRSVAQAAADAGARSEALDLLPRLVRWADEHKVYAPITHGLAEVLLGKSSREEAIRGLMSGPVYDE